MGIKIEFISGRLLRYNRKHPLSKFPLMSLSSLESLVHPRLHLSSWTTLFEAEARTRKETEERYTEYKRCVISRNYNVAKDFKWEQSVEEESGSCDSTEDNQLW